MTRRHGAECGRRRTLRRFMMVLAGLFLVLGYSKIGSIAQAKTQLTRDYVSVIAPRTVYPFLSVTSDRFGTETQFKFPRIEITNTQTAFKLLCGGTGSEYPDLAMTNREMTDSESKFCTLNNVTELAKVHLGYDAVSLATFGRDFTNILPEQLFLALAGTVPAPPVGSDNGSRGRYLGPDIESALIANPYGLWSDIDPALPSAPINVFVPSEDTAAYDLFIGIILEGCRRLPRFAALEARNRSSFRQQCTILRRDEKLRTYSGDLEATLSTLSRAPGQLILVPQVALARYEESLHSMQIDGTAPTIEMINRGNYVGARPIFMYFRGNQYAIVPGLRDFITELTDKRTIGPEGYLRPLGFVPLSEEDRAQTSSIVGDFDRQEVGIVDDDRGGRSSVSPKTRLRQVDTALWDWVRVTNDPDMIRVYIDLLPDGVFARFARERETLLRQSMVEGSQATSAKCPSGGTAQRGECDTPHLPDPTPVADQCLPGEQAGKNGPEDCWAFANLVIGAGTIALDAQQEREMQQIVQTLQSAPDMKIDVVSRSTSPAADGELGTSFAYLAAMAHYLAGAGVGPERIAFIGHSSAIPSVHQADRDHLIEIRTRAKHR